MAILACLYVASFTVQNIIAGSHPQFKSYAIIVSAVIWFCSLILGVMKYVLASESRLNSYTLHMDAITSFFVSTLALLYLIAYALHFVWDAPMFEHIAALVITVGLLCYAVYNLCRTKYEGHPWYSKELWKWKLSAPLGL
jgi:divalent metal cation (Fe/Co/Zn/Cd) transporter